MFLQILLWWISAETSLTIINQLYSICGYICGNSWFTSMLMVLYKKEEYHDINIGILLNFLHFTINMARLHQYIKSISTSRFYFCTEQLAVPWGLYWGVLLVEELSTLAWRPAPGWDNIAGGVKVRGWGPRFNIKMFYFITCIGNIVVHIRYL